MLSVCACASGGKADTHTSNMKLRPDGCNRPRALPQFFIELSKHFKPTADTVFRGGPAAKLRVHRLCRAVHHDICKDLN